MPDVVAEVKLKSITAPTVIQVIIKDALCSCCLKDANTVIYDSLICRECFEWIGFNKFGGILMKNNHMQIRTMFTRIEYLERLKNGSDVSKFD